ncbi:hypothetical protein JYU34_016238 [Plutella xylostella]|uniref:CHK kinase-like domain-containing protein n=1 Tax=Plutella xylostella TaxID=51655 RepID=A0ABQ7Q2D1_PLUXY|nr:hypothetical protein JYU34_016238 [Plutella xylostella]
MKFQGEIETLSEVQKKTIEDALRKQGFSDETIVTGCDAGKKGDNYSSSVKRVTATDAGDKTMTMIAKIAPTLETIRQMMGLPILFANEITMYEEFLPKLVALQKSAGVPDDDLVKYAECYGVVSEAPHELILLEDLKATGHDMLDRKVSFTNDQMVTVLKRLATYHSLSHVLREKEPGVFDRFKNGLVDVWAMFHEIEFFKENFNQMETQLLGFLETDQQRNQVKGVVSQATKCAVDFQKLEKDSRYAVIIQGDCWTNNMMFKHEDGKLDCIMVDYQVSKISSPVMDVFFTIFNCSDHEARTRHYFDWLDVYYKSFEESLFNFNMKANFVYPRDKFDADLKRYGRYAFGLCLAFTGVLVRGSEDVIDAGSATEESLQKLVEAGDVLSLDKIQDDTSERMKKRVRDLWASFSEYGYL